MSQSQFVVVSHPDIAAPGVVARSALPYLGDGWVVEGEAASTLVGEVDVPDEPQEHAHTRTPKKSAT